MHGAVNPSSAGQRGIRGVHYGVDSNLGDIAYYQLQLASPGLYYQHC
jgi:hypothetical protein